MATVYWFGGSGNWSDQANHWSNNSGNSPASLHGSVPGTDDSVVFNTSSSAAEAAYTVTIDATANCLDFTMDGPSSTDATKVTLAGSSTLNVYGSFSLSGGTAGITITYTGSINFKATSSGKTIDFNSVGLASFLTFDGVNGAWTIQNSFTTTSSLYFLNGTYNGNNKDITAVAMTIGSSTSTVNLGNGTYTLSSTSRFIDFRTSITGFNCNSSVIIATGNNAILDGNGATFYDVRLTGTSHTINGSNSFTNLTRTGTATITDQLYIQAGKTQTISGVCKLEGNSSLNRLLITSDTDGTAATIHSASWTGTKNVDFRYITSTDAVDLSAIDGGSGNCCGNTGITFTTADTWYWHSDSGNISDYTKWYTDTNGGGSQMASTLVPLPQDTLIFDGSSFTTGTRVITQNMLRIGSIDFTDATNTPNLTFSSQPFLYGSFILISGMTLTPASLTPIARGGSDYMPVGGWLFNGAGKTFDNSLTFQCYTGTYKLTGNLTVTNSIALYAGTLNANNVTITTLSFVFNGSATRTLDMGSATFVIGSGWTAGATNLTVTKGTSLIKAVRSTSGSISFTGAGKEYNNFWFSPTGNYICSFQDSNTFNDFKIDAGREVNFVNSSTTTVTTFTALGTSGSNIIIHPASGTATLTKAGGGIITGCDYINITSMIGSPNLTWYIGANSTITTCTNIYKTQVTSNIKSYNTNLLANVKTINTNAIANVKTLNTNTNV